MNDETLRRIRREIRSWTARPPARSPQVARTRVLARLDKRRPRPSWRLAAVSVLVTALALAAGLFLLGPEKSDAPAVVTSVDRPAGEHAARGLLVYELRSGTKLYLALGPKAPDSRPAIKRP